MTALLQRLSLFFLLVSVACAAAPDVDVPAALIQANDTRIDRVLQKPDALRPGSFGGPRGAGAEIMTLAAAYGEARSSHHHGAKALAAMSELTASLEKVQLPDGLFDVGNLDSPPDSAFILKTLAKAQLFLVRDNQAASEPLRVRLKSLILSIAEGVRTGGVHTPNHRWAVCSALAHVNQLYPDQKYLDRIEDWLGEGIDQDADGQWAERSPNYTSDVNNPAMLDLAILLKRPALFAYVRKSLEMTLYQVEVNGEVETVASRRQDQAQRARKPIWEYYVPYRYLAVLDGNPRFAAMARHIENNFLDEIGAIPGNMSSALTCMLEYPEMTAALPAGTALPENYAKVFPGTALARIRRGDTTATIFGGSDWHLGHGMASGLSTNPAFFKFRKGKAVLDSVRLSNAFFNTGFFYSDGLEVTGENTYRLRQTLSVPYHQPLPKAARKASGDYKLTPEGRFYSKMDFPHRPKQLKTLVTTVTIHENNGAFELAFDIDGYPGVPVTLELCFRPDGTLAGVEQPELSSELRGARTGPAMENDANSFILKNGTGTYTVGDDKIEFGPGVFAHSRLRMEGEMFAVYNGHLRAEGVRVYLTGITPFKHVITIR